MIEIPENPMPRDFQQEVDAAVEEVLKGLNSSGRVGALSVNHGTSHFHVMNDVASEVAARFKAKGYHAHYCYSVRGVAYALEITTYPTNHDI